MGYTHYWEHPDIDPETFAALGQDVKAIVLASELPIVGWHGDEDSLPQYAETQDYGPRIALNGRGEDARESFVIEHAATDFEFCKTAYKPYDVVVTASLLALRDRVPGTRLSSDGDAPDWIAGHALAERALHRTIEPFT